ncbi:class I SAM-dependent methyltransferase [Puniceicoccus vermicola]|uniref:Class I SAM-dependent methyltransferase n=1 Tax=Puniceicoccus vermicola TaxID=388746 RepID=A0A7X1AWE3_9BACT|nr:class I SAM-dependent methyltransferase [Puniceicoccus vermicola]MBC2601067.1 class I SAM-dependent methyltransferase [Puniceicoccus vermicola]
MSNFKTEDIRPSDLMAQKKWAVEADKQFLLDHLDQFVQSNCPACGSSNSGEWGRKDGFIYHQCADCKTHFTNPRPSTELLGQFYRQSKNYEVWNSVIFPATEKTRKDKIFTPRAKQTVALCKHYGSSGGTMLEVGAAYGIYCEAIRDQNFFDHIIAVEPTPGHAETCRRKGFETYEETIEELSHPTGQADVIAAFEVIEHLSEPSLFVKKTSEYLKPGGIFIGSCPNGISLGGLLLKEKFSSFDHEHTTLFNPESMAIMLKNCGLEPLEVTTPGELDVDLLINQVDDPSEIDCPIIQQILPDPDDDVIEKLQEFIKAAKLSSHMWFVARKPS